MNEEYPLMAFIANEGVAPKGERYDRSSLVTDTENKLYKRTEFGDFIYSSNNLETGSIGLNKYGKACISPVYSVFHPTGIADSNFLGRRLVRKDFINSMVKWRQGVIYGQWRIHESDFLKIDIPVPSVEEQIQIGTFLDYLDNLITLHQRNSADFVSRFFSDFTNTWEQRKLGDIVGIYDGVHQTPNYQNSGVMFLSVENIATLKSSKFISEEDFKRDYKVFPQENDILMTRIGDVGTTNVVTDNGLKAYYVSLALLKYKSTDPYFLSNAIQSDYVQKGLANRTLKTAIPMKINKDEIGKVSVMLPLSATEQQQIGTYFRNLDNLITLHQCEYIFKK